MSQEMTKSDFMEQAGKNSGDDLLAFAEEVENRQEGKHADVAPVAEVQIVTFFLDTEEYGVPVQRVREITRVSEITRMPHAPSHVRGVINLRGRIIPVVEIRTCLGLQAIEITERSRIIFVEVRNRLLGVLVDGVAQVLKVPSNTLSDAPEDVVSGDASHIIGVAQFEERLIVLMDLERVLFSLRQNV